MKKTFFLSLIQKIPYIFTFFLLFIIPFEGLVLDSFNIALLGHDAIFLLYKISILLSIISRNWKLLLITAVGGIVMYSITLGLSEILWYYLYTIFGIDISYR